MPIYDSNSTSASDNAFVEIASGDQSGYIADVTDEKRLKVDSLVTGIALPYIDASQLKFDDMNAANGGLARNTSIPVTFTNLYLYTGSGLFKTFIVNLDGTDKAWIRLIIDGNDILFDLNGLYNKDLKDNNVYDVQDIDMTTVGGLGMHDNAIRYEPNVSIKFDSSVVIQARSTGRKFKAGFVSLIKIT